MSTTSPNLSLTLAEPSDQVDVDQHVAGNFSIIDQKWSTPGAPEAVQVGSSGNPGASTVVSRSDHIHGIDVGAPVDVGTANAAGSSTDVAAADHVHKLGASTVPTAALQDGAVTTDKIADANVTRAKMEAVAVFPIGAFLPYGGSAAPTSAGWLLCDGAAVSRSTFAALFAVLGTAYGSGDGFTTFNLPDLRGRVPVGLGTGFTPLGATGGATTASLAHTHTGPSHTHTGPSHTHTGPSHTHTGPSHQHDGVDHTHNVAAHVHTISSHTHTGPSHNHSGGSHSHSGPSHTHSGPSHSHGVSAAGVGGSTGNATPVTGNQNVTSGTGSEVYVGQHSHDSGSLDVTGSTDAGGTGATGAAGTGATSSDSSGDTGFAGTGNTGGSGELNTSTVSTAATGASNQALATGFAGSGSTSAGGTGATSASGTGDTGASGTGNTGSSLSATESIVQPYQVVHYIVYAGVAS